MRGSERYDWPDPYKAALIACGIDIAGRLLFMGLEIPLHTQPCTEHDAVLLANIANLSLIDNTGMPPVNTNPVKHSAYQGFLVRKALILKEKEKEKDNKLLVSALLMTPPLSLQISPWYNKPQEILPKWSKSLPFSLKEATMVLPNALSQGTRRQHTSTRYRYTKVKALVPVRKVARLPFSTKCWTPSHSKPLIQIRGSLLARQCPREKVLECVPSDKTTLNNGQDWLTISYAPLLVKPLSASQGYLQPTTETSTNTCIVLFHNPVNFYWKPVSKNISGTPAPLLHQHRTVALIRENKNLAGEGGEFSLR